MQATINTSLAQDPVLIESV